MLACRAMTLFDAPSVRRAKTVSSRSDKRDPAAGPWTNAAFLGLESRPQTTERISCDGATLSPSRTISSDLHNDSQVIALVRQASAPALNASIMPFTV